MINKKQVFLLFVQKVFSALNFSLILQKKLGREKHLEILEALEIARNILLQGAPLKKSFFRKYDICMHQKFIH